MRLGGRLRLMPRPRAAAPDSAAVNGNVGPIARADRPCPNVQIGNVRRLTTTSCPNIALTGCALLDACLKGECMNRLLRNLLFAAGVLVAGTAAAQVTFYDGEGFAGRSFTADR